MSQGQDNTNTLRLIGAALLLCCGTHVASGETLCAGMGTNDRVRPIPQSLLVFADTLFGNDPEETVYRCANDSVFICRRRNGFGCDKPSMIRRLPSVERFCREERNGDVPMVASGHNSAYSWKCVGGRAVIDERKRIDERGFLADNWIPVAGVR
jgi:hypothetical protein